MKVPSPHRTTDGQRYRRHSQVVVLIAIAAGAGAAFAPGAAIAIPVADAVLRIVFAVGVTLVATQARRWTWAVATGITVLVTTGSWPLFVLACALFAVAIGALVLDRRSRMVGAVMGAGVTLLGLWAPVVGPTGLTAAAVALAAGVLFVSGLRNLPHRIRRTVVVTAIVLGILAVLATAAFGVSAARARSHALTGATAARAAIDAARGGDTASAQRKFAAALTELRAADDIAGKPWARVARVVPFVGQNADAFDRLVQNAIALAETGEYATTKADVQRLRTVDGRLDPAAVAALDEPLRRVDAALTKARADLADASSPWMIGPLHEQYTKLRAQLDKAAHDTRTARIGVQAAPELLGVDRPRRYFLMFTTPSEGRAGGGGFMGNWGVLTATDGKLELTEFGRSNELNPEGGSRTLTGPDDYVARYTRFGVTEDWRNVNMAPDFPTVAKVVGELAPQSAAGKVDGVLAVDPEGLAALLKLTGPVQVDGLAEPLTSENAARILLRDQYTVFPETPDRVDFLEGASRAVTEKFTNSTLPGPRTVGKTLGPAVRDGHLSFVSFDPTGEEMLSRIGMTAALPTRHRDSFGLVTQNASASKLELFLHRTVQLRSELDPATGTETTTATVRLRNDAPSSGLPAYVIGNSLGLPPGTSRLYLSAYSPLRLEGATVDGVPVALGSETEHGLQVYSTYVEIPAGGEVTLQLRLRGDLQGAVTTTKDGTVDYRLAVWRPVMVNPDKLSVRVRTRDGGVGTPTVSYAGTLVRTRTFTAPIG